MKAEEGNDGSRVEIGTVANNRVTTVGILQRHAGHHNGIVVIISKDQRFRHEGITVTSVRSARLRVPECPFIFSAVAIIDPTCDKMSRFFHSKESISITFSSGCR